MEKPRTRSRRFLVLPVVALVAGCQSYPSLQLTEAQESELSAHAGVYHLCVAQTAARMDDGRSAVTQIAAFALTWCKPEATQIASYLDSIKQPAEAKAHYLDELSDVAARQSAIMLRRRRHPDWQAGAA